MPKSVVLSKAVRVDPIVEDRGIAAILRALGARK